MSGEIHSGFLPQASITIFGYLIDMDPRDQELASLGNFPRLRLFHDSDDEPEITCFHSVDSIRTVLVCTAFPACHAVWRVTSVTVVTLLR